MAYKQLTQNVYTNTKIALSLSQTVTMVQSKKASYVKTQQIVLTYSSRYIDYRH